MFALFSASRLSLIKIMFDKTESGRGEELLKTNIITNGEKEKNH